MNFRKVKEYLAPQYISSASSTIDGYLAMLIQRSLPSPLENLWDAEFKVYSQWGEDGILNYLCEKLGLSKPKMIELGAGNFEECNSRFLAEYRHASVAPVDARSDLHSSVQNLDINWKTTIVPQVTWITPDNVNELIKSSAKALGGIDILSLDIDGNDYWVADSLDTSNFQIIIVEYNPIFGHERSVTVPRNDSFDRTSAHYSNLYYGASLRSFINLFDSKNFTFVGTNRVGNNAFFVPDTKINNLDLQIPRTDDLSKFTDWRVRESRSTEGQLTFLNCREGADLIKELQLIELKS